MHVDAQEADDLVGSDALGQSFLHAIASYDAYHHVGHLDRTSGVDEQRQHGHMQRTRYVRNNSMMCKCASCLKFVLDDDSQSFFYENASRRVGLGHSRILLMVR